MRRPMLLVTCLLLLATGLALLGLGEAVTQPVESGRPLVAAPHVALVRAFYAAANATLRTGDATGLAAILAPDLVEHPPHVGTTGQTGLVQALVARHAVFPGLRLVVDDLRAANDDVVAVRVHAEGVAAGSFLGLSVPPRLATWGPIELVRIANGQIAGGTGGWRRLTKRNLALSHRQLPLDSTPLDTATSAG